MSVESIDVHAKAICRAAAEADVPRGTLDFQRHWTRILFRTLEQLRDTPEEYYRICSELDAQDVERTLMRMIAGNDLLAIENGWTYDASIGRIIPAWFSIQ